ncbi:1-deoxy-D-xylulose-5-phosphate synthase N-terminal domain-containing protein [Streptomyces sp. NPDC127068]|uniref:1-deoxy-D-xylulose-5-phosphate synthase N-terminal domain-containing protein n=1 Tax=Streptomyces sp. NPDC127068 TaxID=3347127 RepID=UPI00364CC5BA
MTDPVLLRRLAPEQPRDLTARMRAFLVDQVAATGDYLGASTSTVKLSIALHRVFESLHDTLPFDIGRQRCAHTALTDRGVGFTALRTRSGPSGYPSRSSSAHDYWGENSHAPTSPGCADGLAKTSELTWSPSRRWSRSSVTALWASEPPPAR